MYPKSNSRCGNCNPLLPAISSSSPVGAILHEEKPFTQEETDKLFADFYADAAFTHYVPHAPDLKQAVNTNKALVHADAFDDKWLITAVIDNLLKGASGQAVQNMNLMFGLDETAGLRLKPVAF